jgi:hypothetical protein
MQDPNVFCKFLLVHQEREHGLEHFYKPRQAKNQQVLQNSRNVGRDE